MNVRSFIDEEKITGGNMKIEKIFNTGQLAEMLGLKAQTLRLWRLRGCGPHYIRYGGSKSRVYYRMKDIDSWLCQHTFNSTSDESQRRKSL